MRQRHPLRRSRGTAILELAIILPFLLLMSFGALEYSLAISEYKSLTLQTRIAARYLSSRAPGDLASQEEAICLVKYGVTSASSCTGALIAPGLANAIVSIEDPMNSASHNAQSSGPGPYQVRLNLVTVKISGYQYRPIVGSFLSGFSGNTSITFNPISTTMRQIL
jgi:Flp pilus assembly protein TadG